MMPPINPFLFILATKIFRPGRLSESESFVLTGRYAVIAWLMLIAVCIALIVFIWWACFSPVHAQEAAVARITERT